MLAICLRIRNQTHASVKHLTGTDSYFENFLHVIFGINAEMRRKLMSAFIQWLVMYFLALGSCIYDVYKILTKNWLPYPHIQMHLKLTCLNPAKMHFFTFIILSLLSSVAVALIQYQYHVLYQSLFLSFSYGSCCFISIYRATVFL